MTLAKVKEQDFKKERNKALKRKGTRWDDACKSEETRWNDSQVDLHQRLEGCSPMK